MDKNVLEYFRGNIDDLSIQIWHKRNEMREANKENYTTVGVAAELLSVASELLDQASALIKPEDDEQDD